MQYSNDPDRRYGLVQPQMPTGCRFAPSDEVLVNHYLSKKAKNEPLPCPYAVRECDLYGREPEEIWKEFGGDRLKRKIDQDLGLFFFTRLKKKSGSHGSSRIHRSVGNNIGTWHEERAIRNIICSETKEKIGSKKRFVYRSNKSHNSCGVSWYMLEISLPNYNSDYVVCQLRKKERNSIESGRGDARVENDNGQGVQKLQRTVSWTIQEAGPSFFNSNKTPESYEAKRNSSGRGKEMVASIGGGISFDLNVEWTNPDEDDTDTSHKEPQRLGYFSSWKKMTEIASSSLASLETDKGNNHVEKAKEQCALTLNLSFCSTPQSPLVINSSEST